MVLYQIIMYWLAIGLYVISTVLYVISNDFHKSSLMRWATRFAVVGTVPHGIGIILRWIEAGHAPYTQLYEVSATNTWLSMAFYLFLQSRNKRLEPLGIIIVPVSFLFLAAGVMSSKEVLEIPPTFQTYWLFVHVLFAKLAYGATLIGAGLAAFYLLKLRFKSFILEKLPDSDVTDELSYKFMGVGFVFNTIMIVAGSIWAKSAWGSYWSWDPIETWSLIAWLIYGIYLHLRRTFGWRGQRAAWLALLTFGVMIFALFGIVLIYPSIHELYLNPKGKIN